MPFINQASSAFLVAQGIRHQSASMQFNIHPPYENDSLFCIILIITEHLTTWRSSYVRTNVLIYLVHEVNLYAMIPFASLSLLSKVWWIKCVAPLGHDGNASARRADVRQWGTMRGNSIYLTSENYEMVALRHDDLTHPNGNTPLFRADVIQRTSRHNLLS